MVAGKVQGLVRFSRSTQSFVNPKSEDLMQLKLNFRRQRGRVEAGGSEFKSHLTASWICFTENLSFKSSATLVNSQLVCLRPVGILNPVMFNLYVDLIICIAWH